MVRWSGTVRSIIRAIITFTYHFLIIDIFFTDEIHGTRLKRQDVDGKVNLKYETVKLVEGNRTLFFCIIF